MFVQQLGEGRVRLMTSASDLTAASACEFAFLRRVDARFGRDVTVPADDDPMLARAARLGDAHEDRVLKQYFEAFGTYKIGTESGVASIDRADSRDQAALAAAEAQTLAALRGGADVVFQATFFDPAVRKAAGSAPEIGFIGYADFLRRVEARSSSGTPAGGWAYEVQDTKLARRAKVSALMQLAAYAEQLTRLGVPVSPEVVLILGDGAHSRHLLADIAPVFRARRERLHELLLVRAAVVGPDGTRETGAPIAWGDAETVACGRCEVCEPEVVRTRDALLIAGIRFAQRDRLLEAGLGTIDQVAAALPAILAANLTVEGVSAPVLERIAWQAALQVESAPDAPLPYRVTSPAALQVLPAPNPGDLFFDFEGDPFYSEQGRDGRIQWGLDYLFGMVDTNETFTSFWAHDLAAERAALRDFLALVAKRRLAHPEMKIYHYAAYERTHLLSIASRHGTLEAEVDQLLRDHVLVDLYPIVRSALRIGTRSYSIKKLEPLYVGDQLRDQGGVTSGAESVTEYADACELLVDASTERRAEGQIRLDAIADYNRYDCVSTLRLRDWLLRVRAEHPTPMGPRLPLIGGPVDAVEEAPVFSQSEVAASLQMHAALASGETERQAIALAASAIDYHEREQKSFWWAHFARLIDPIEDWAHTRDVMIIDPVGSQIEVDWFRMPKGRVDRREIHLSGAIAPGSSFSSGSQVFALYDRPAPFAQRGAAPGARTARLVTVLEVHDDGVTIGETLPQDVSAYYVLPIALVPGPPPNAGVQKQAILEWGRGFAAALDRGAFPIDPAVDVLRRAAPHLAGAASLTELRASRAECADVVDEVLRAVRSLVRGTLPVQGPPGTGKTYLAAHVIARLVSEYGWRIGVVGQSHKVVENVLDAVVRAGLDPEFVAKELQAAPRITRAPRSAEPAPKSSHAVGSTPTGIASATGSLISQPERLFSPLRRGEHSRFLDNHRDTGCVIGGTAWTFANSGKVPRGSLDLLVIDEAGQFSLAPTIASSVAAQRLLLLGDPQQLPQVSQGSHPEPVDMSALGWLLGQRDTLPEQLGFFLAETRRMRPELAEVVSELSYGGRLLPHPTAGLREVVGAGPPGLVWHRVSHQGNSTYSPEEAAEVVRVVRSCLGAMLREPVEPVEPVEPGEPGHASEQPRPLTAHDVIVVAAYNAQVECVSDALAAAGLGAVRVGTVDKFQGQEAIISVITLAASSAADVPRGLEFLLLRNRLNVAISRGKWAAHLISSERLGDGLPATAEGVAALSGYLRLTELG